MRTLRSRAILPLLLLCWSGTVTAQDADTPQACVQRVATAANTAADPSIDQLAAACAGPVGEAFQGLVHIRDATTDLEASVRQAGKVDPDTQRFLKGLLGILPIRKGAIVRRSGLRRLRTDLRIGATRVDGPRATVALTSSVAGVETATTAHLVRGPKGWRLADLRVPGKTTSLADNEVLSRIGELHSGYAELLRSLRGEAARGLRGAALERRFEELAGQLIEDIAVVWEARDDPHKRRLNLLRVSDRGLAWLHRHRHLERLRLKRNLRITDAGLAHVGRVGNLRRLDLSRCTTITNAGLEHLSGLVNLERLELEHCTGISDAGLGHLSGLKALERLDLTGCTEITDAGLVHLRGLKRLRLLRLKGTAVSPGGKDALQKALPGCKIR